MISPAETIVNHTDTAFYEGKNSNTDPKGGPSKGNHLYEKQLSEATAEVQSARPDGN
jgi:hypothetical protein